MVAQTDTDPMTGTAPIRSRSNAQRLIRTVGRLIGIQARLLLLRTQLTARRVLLYAGLMAGALGCVLVGAIFLLIGLFKVLTVVLTYMVGPNWAPALAFLIFAVVLLGIALVLVLLARNVFAAPKSGQTAASSELPSQSSEMHV